MPKMKTHKSGAKRYRVTATGKVIHNSIKAEQAAPAASAN